MAQIYLSGPAIASLRASAGMTENKLMRAGRYGPVLRHDHVAFVAVEAIERRIGEPITPERLVLAAAGKPNRMLFAAPGGQITFQKRPVRRCARSRRTWPTRMRVSPICAASDGPHWLSGAKPVLRQRKYLPGIHNVVRVKCLLDRPHGNERAAVLGFKIFHLALSDAVLARAGAVHGDCA